VFESAYPKLREQILRGSVGQIEPWGASDGPIATLMDWNLGSGTATVVAVADGSASIYASTGGGHIGGGQSHKEIRQAAFQALGVAYELRGLLRLTSEFPFPSPGEVFFYLVTGIGVYIAVDEVEPLAAQTSPLTRLGNAMQQIVTLYDKLPQTK